MNLWKNYKMTLRCKIKYWLIKKLGGYTLDELPFQCKHEITYTGRPIDDVNLNLSADAQMLRYHEYINDVKDSLANEIGQYLIDHRLLDYSTEYHHADSTLVVRIHAGVIHPSHIGNDNIEEVIHDACTKYHLIEEGELYI